MKLATIFVVFTWANLYALIWAVLLFPTIREMSAVGWIGVFFLLMAIVSSINYSQEKPKNVD